MAANLILAIDFCNTLNHFFTITMDAETKKEFERLNKKLNELAARQRTETWVGPGWITDLTGWNNEKLRQAREQKIVGFKRSDGGGWLYKLESVPEQFIIKKQTA